MNYALLSIIVGLVSVIILLYLSNRRLKADLVQADDLVELVMPVVREYEPMPQSGEWKFHQVYARIIKHPSMAGVDRWRIGLAIHQAIARIRLGEGAQHV